MNLDMLYQAAEITLDPKYERIANSQAEQSSRSHVRPDFTTCHVVNMDQKTGEPIEFLTAQGMLRTLTFAVFLTLSGYADDSCWARGQAWAIYGYSQCGTSPAITVFVLNFRSYAYWAVRLSRALRQACRRVLWTASANRGPVVVSSAAEEGSLILRGISRRRSLALTMLPLLPSPLAECCD